MTKKIVLWVLLPVVAIAVGVYFWLGGFQSIEIEEVQHQPRVIWGTPYQGKYGDLKLREIFVTTQQLLREGKVQGTLVVVNYDSLFNTQKVNQFIGVLPVPPVEMANLPEKADTLIGGKYLRVHLYGQPAVRPTPEQTDQKVREYASQQGLMLGAKMVEHYFGADSMWVEYPISIKK
uniref:Uncharacterized protein n=1 Tax=Roseihalotalea indica TaxID=2867963 RepID=A0AA49JK83_9BACT|nr:hypothetical protein K4G66_15765 [Tunicatimonas sp. TK19036]